MKSICTVLLLFCFAILGIGQSSIKGLLQDDQSQPVIYSNIALYSVTDSSLVKVETSDADGVFNMLNIPAGSYFIKASYVGLQDLVKPNIQLDGSKNIDLGILSFTAASTDLEEITVTADRAMVEVKPDRTVFNVQGTINSVGEDALALMRKAPGVIVDNNENISVLGRSGVQIFVDGKRLPLSGDQLTGYLKNLTAEQIDRIDIISNPGAKYDAEGNAGIIDIRMKRDKNLGANGSLSGTYGKGLYENYNIAGTANYRNKAINIFANGGIGRRVGYHEIIFLNFQNGIITDEVNEFVNTSDNLNLRLGTDFFIGKKHTLGFLATLGQSTTDGLSNARIALSDESTPSIIDSILIANNNSDAANDFNTYNVNYQFEIDKDQSLNIDLDYGSYKNESQRTQPNEYFNATEDTILTKITAFFDTPTNIDIYTARFDYENKLAGGKVGLGAKYSQVVSDNTFLHFDEINSVNILNNERSNEFTYNEKVFAGYLSYNRPINQKWSFSAGLRAEHTDAIGDLTTYLASLQEPPVEQNYLSWFPNAGLTWNVAQGKTFNLNYARRINRPDYKVLNPFRNRLSELSYEKGNPRLSPEIVNNVELGYTLNYRYNFKLAYSVTEDQITRLIGPDDIDPRAGFITWANLSEQKVLNFNVSAPMQPAKKWTMYTNLSASYIDNQADYGDGAVVDVQAFSYSIYQQHTFQLPSKFKAEVSGYFSGPGVWGGVFKYRSNWSLNLGIQRKFFNDQMNVRLSANDIFFQSGWEGESAFNGLRSEGSGNWDSRRVSISISHNFGNQNVKSRKRKTGLEDEKSRVGSGN